MVRQRGTSAGRFKSGRRTAEGGEDKLDRQPPPPWGLSFCLFRLLPSGPLFFFFFVFLNPYIHVSAKTRHDLPCIGHVF